MHRKSVILLVIACTLLACNWGASDTDKPEITTDTLKYTYKVIKRKSADCDSKKDSGCKLVQIRYPVFVSQQALNDSISQNILTSFKLDDKKPDSNLPELSNHFVTLYEEAKRNDKRSNLIYQLDSKAIVIRQDSTLLIIEFTSYSFTGGAHGLTSTNFLNWDTKTNRRIVLNDILTEGYAESLNTVAEKIFRKQEKLSDSASLKSGYFFKGDKFALNNNFLITPIGIRFLYNQYEIKPYSAGQTSLLIPYSQIESLLRPNTVITQYHK